jgi:hypothetical protein
LKNDGPAEILEIHRKSWLKDLFQIRIHEESSDELRSDPAGAFGGGA